MYSSHFLWVKLQQLTSISFFTGKKNKKKKERKGKKKKSKTRHCLVEENE